MKDYIVRFIRNDNKPCEEYCYATEPEASDHIDRFLSDDSGLYRFIALYDAERDIVLRILTFEEGVLRVDFRDRDIVRLRSGHRAPGEEKFIYSVTNIHEETGRCTIFCLNSGMAIQPSETVMLDDIDRIVGIEDVIPQ